MKVGQTSTFLLGAWVVMNIIKMGVSMCGERICWLKGKTQGIPKQHKRCLYYRNRLHIVICRVASDLLSDEAVSRSRH